MYAIFIPFSKLCLALRLSVICGTYVWHWVCLFVGWVTYVGHLVCLFVGWVTYVWKWLGYLEQAQLINCFWNIW